MNRKVFTLVGEVQRRTAIDFIAGLAIKPDKPVQVVVQPKPRRRTLDQNALLHKWFRVIQEHLLDAGVGHYSEDGVKEFFKEKFLEKIPVSIGGEVRYVLPSTADLEVEPMSTFMHRIEEYCYEYFDLYLPTREQLE